LITPKTYTLLSTIKQLAMSLLSSAFSFFILLINIFQYLTQSMPGAQKGPSKTLFVDGPLYLQNHHDNILYDT